jgi:hypothetical protein
VPYALERRLERVSREANSYSTFSTWDDRQYVDISYMRTPMKAKEMKTPDLHFDVTGLRKDEAVSPICLYFATVAKPVSLNFIETSKSETKKKVGRKPEIRELRAVSNSVFVFDPTKIKHGTAAWVAGQTRPPRRVNILLYCLCAVPATGV